MDTEQQLTICKAMFGKMRKYRGVFYWAKGEKLVNIQTAQVIYESKTKGQKKYDVVCKKNFVLVNRGSAYMPRPNYMVYTTDVYSTTGKLLIRLELNDGNIKYLKNIQLKNGLAILHNLRHNIVTNKETAYKRIFIYDEKSDSIIYTFRYILAMYDYDELVYIRFVHTNEQGESKIETCTLYKK